VLFIGLFEREDDKNKFTAKKMDKKILDENNG